MAWLEMQHCWYEYKGSTEAAVLSLHRRMFTFVPNDREIHENRKEEPRVKTCELL